MEATDLNLSHLKKKLRSFFLKKNIEKVQKCEACVERQIVSSTSAKVDEFPLSEEDVGVVLAALNVPQGDSVLTERVLWMRVECASSLKNLVELYMKLGELRKNFNELRRKLWKGIILGGLGESKQTWTVWKKETRELDNIYPSRLVTHKDRGTEIIHKNIPSQCPGNGFGNKSCVENDVKLNKMTPVVMLERLNSPTRETVSCEVKKVLTMEQESWSENDNMPEESASSSEDETNEKSPSVQQEVSERELRVKKPVDYSELCTDQFNEEDYDFVPIDDGVDEEKEEEEPVIPSINNTLESVEVPTHISTVQNTVQPQPTVNLTTVQQHVCSQCDMTFTRRYDMFRHIEEEHKKQPPVEEEERRKPHLKCPFCPKSFFKAPSLWKHKNFTHPELMQRKCPSCPEIFQREWTLEKHRREAHKFIPPKVTPLDLSLQCSICKRTFMSAYVCRKHVANMHGNNARKRKPYKCPHCEASFVNCVFFRRHFYLVHPEVHLKDKPYPCLVCFHTFPSSGDLKDHMQRHESLKCTTCGKYLPTTVLLKKHLNMHERTETN